MQLSKKRKRKPRHTLKQKTGSGRGSNEDQEKLRRKIHRQHIPAIYWKVKIASIEA